MSSEKKRKIDDKFEDGTPEKAGSPMEDNKTRTPFPKSAQRLKRSHVEENQFSRSQDDHAEYYMEQILNLYKEELCDDNVPVLAIYEVRRLMEVVIEKYRPWIGDVFVTGSSECCQLGNASHNSVSRLTPLNELFDRDIVHVTCGAMSNFVLDRMGRVYSWGASDKGALARRTDVDADPETEYKAIRILAFNPSKLGPVKIPASNEDSNILQVAAGAGHVLFLTNNGAVYVAGSYVIDNKAWREEPPPDQPDRDNTTTDLYEGAAPDGFRDEPRHVYRMPQLVDKVFAGSSMSAARLVDGTLVTWGLDAKGELGRGTSQQKCDIVLNPPDKAAIKERFSILKDDFLLPKPVTFSEPIGKYTVLDVAIGQNHMLVVLRLEGESQTRVYSSGLNQYGQLGLGDNENRNVLTLIPESLGKFIVSVAAGLFHSMFLDITGQYIYTCGRCDSGQLGIQDKISEPGDYRSTLQMLPFDIEDPREDLYFKQIAAGENSCFAVTRTGKLYSWGFGEMGQLGHGIMADQPRATPVKESGFVVEVASGSQHTIVLANREAIKNQ